MSIESKLAHLFHWPLRPEHQQSLLRVIALPIGARGKLRYRDEWVNKTFADEINNINESGGLNAIFWALSNIQTLKNGKVVTTFDFACPVRLVNILNVEEKNGCKYINFIAKEFLFNFQKINRQIDLKNYVKIEFGNPGMPYPGAKKSLVYIGPKINDIKTTQTPSLEHLYAALEDIPCARTYKEEITIKKYPLVIIKAIEKSEVNESGLYKLSLNQEYKLDFSYYQGESYRDRTVYINDDEFLGKSVTDKITILETMKSQDKINIEVKFNNLNFLIPLDVVVEIPWYKRAFTALSILFAISVLSYFLFVKFLPSSPIEIRVALVLSLIVIFLHKLWEVLTKKD